MQVQVLGAERRRRWSLDEKVRVVEETLQAGVRVSDVARARGLAPSVVFGWRRLAREGRLGGGAPAAALVPVEIASEPGPAAACSPQPASLPSASREKIGLIEIELGGCRVRVDRDVDAEALQRVLELLRRR